MSFGAPVLRHMGPGTRMKTRMIQMGNAPGMTPCSLPERPDVARADSQRHPSSSFPAPGSRLLRSVAEAQDALAHVLEPSNKAVAGTGHEGREKAISQH